LDGRLGGPQSRTIRKEEIGKEMEKIVKGGRRKRWKVRKCESG
jgi:hypothetical protein